MADDPVDLAFVDAVDVAKVDVRSLLKNYYELRVSQPSIIQNNDFSGRTGGIYVRSIRVHFEVDLADTTTADDGAQCLVDTAGNRWKAIDGRGTTTIDFGAFPGTGDASVAVTGLKGIVAGAVVHAWIKVADSADHTADEHAVEPPLLEAGAVVASTGFTIYGRARTNGEDVDGAWNVFYRWHN